MLYETAKKAMTPGKGILASDESVNSANKNLIKAGITPAPDMRRDLRSLFINTPNVENYISAIILHDETFWQKDETGKLFRETLKEKDITIVIKVDEGLHELPSMPGEPITLGLDKLEERLPKYYEAGARMAKWRSVIKIDDSRMLPTDAAIDAIAVGLAEYALFCQKFDIVPIIEPEVLLTGNHTIEKAEEITTKVLKAVFEKMNLLKVDLAGTILKSSMVLPGSECEQKATHEEIAQATVRTLKAAVPSEVGGVVFLSGGQSSEDATLNLNEIAKLEPLPWELAFSYLRAIEGPPTKIWAGKSENVEGAREKFIEILEKNIKADKGELV